MARIEAKQRRGVMLVITSPSGAGKTTLCRRLLASDSSLAMSVSATSRAKRPGEQEGKDYFFLTPERFAQLRRQDAFIESAQVFGHAYGTLKSEVLPRLDSGQDVVFDVDWQGAQSLYQRCPTDVVRVYVLPPSIATLRSRLQGRQTDTRATIEARMAKALDELSHSGEADYIILNDDLTRCFSELQAILTAARHCRRRALWLEGWLNDRGGAADPDS